MKQYFYYHRLLFLFMMFFSFHVLAQDGSKIDVKTYKLLRDSVSTAKAELIVLKATTTREIDSLKKFSNDLDEQIKMAYQDLYIYRYGKENGMHVYNKQIWKGMSDKMMRDSWGNPDKIDKNVEKWGVFTQWYYGNVIYFFKNGILTDWEETK